ncbi:MAG: hypothetical protein IPK87_02850 [Planctomycetes bacterium]|nr:hypothetical protein [Planctomycetota bacterium]
MNEAPVRVTGREIALATLAETGVHVTHAQLDEIRNHSSELLRRMRSGEPTVVIVEAPNVQSLDVMALRWMFKGGITPLVLCPGDAAECAELAITAAKAANMLKLPVFFLLEESVAEAEFHLDEPVEEPELLFDVPSPIDASDLSPEESDLRDLEARLSRPPRGFKATRTDSGPSAKGKPEWLVVTYGASCAPAHDAVAGARADGQRVSLLRTRMLWPLPEAEILKAAMGMKHIVVAERNMGQYALEIRRILPELPVISAGRITAPLPASLILQRLQRSPRCC